MLGSKTDIILATQLNNSLLLRPDRPEMKNMTD